MNSPSMSEVLNFPAVPLAPRKEITGKEGWSRSAASAVNFPKLCGAQEGVDFDSDSSLNSETVVLQSNNNSEVTVVQQRIDDSEFSAKSERMTTPSKLQSAAEVIPRPLRSRQQSMRITKLNSCAL